MERDRDRGQWTPLRPKSAAWRQDNSARGGQFVAHIRAQAKLLRIFALKKVPGDDAIISVSKTTCGTL